MASIPCTASATIIQLNFASKPNNSSSSSPSSLVCSCVSTPYHSELNSQFMGVQKRLGWFRPSRIGPSSAGSRATCWFKFGKNGVDAEKAGIYGSQSRNDFDRDDVEQVRSPPLSLLVQISIKFYFLSVFIIVIRSSFKVSHFLF